MALPLRYDFRTKTIISGDEIQGEHENIAAKFNGNIVNADLNANAAISLSKLAGRYQYYSVELTYALAPAGLSLGRQSDVVPLPGTTGDAAWTVSDIYWMGSDTGAGTGQVTIYWGGYNEPGSVGTLTADGATSFGAYTISNGAAANDGNGAAALTGGSTILPWSGNARGLYAEVTTADATATTAGYLKFVVNLRRDIQAA